MVRCRYQGGCLFIRGKKRKMWVARWRENVIQPDGVVQRVLRSAVLGPVSEFAGRLCYAGDLFTSSAQASAPALP